MKKQEVLIIESRSAQDIFDDRYEGETLKQILKLQDVNARYIEAVTESLFVKAIKLAQKEHIKYVHISAHGWEDGFVLTDGTEISWADFDKLAWPCLKDVCLCFSSCSVGKGAEQLFSYHKTFCNVIVAPLRNISWGEGLVAYSAFYHRALSVRTSTEQDVKVLNNIMGRNTFRLIESTCRSTTYALGR